ncbi:hypothetical protein [Sinosporangium siamense]|uniref:Serine/threonine protein kinase n=1 Tax=Sinosporangium siamense TaxID=1367973 RepID=A0A919VBA3_9ACTN|nr:hypothetical protein [Sinosporangium siamense]GII97366.1 hypothetical protein Ssi02_75970 [Sinosporangium siamense]
MSAQPQATLLKSDPRSIGPYRLVHRLGAGGMGTVYAAVDRQGMADV